MSPVQVVGQGNTNNAPTDPFSRDLDRYRRDIGGTGYDQARYNRPNTSGPFGSNTIGADGSVTSSFSGGFGTLNDNLTSQAANVAANPMDWGQFGTLGTGEDAGRQAAQASYSQSLSRLNPQWQKSEKQLRTNMYQSGHADSDGGDATMGEFGRARNDAYSGAMTNAMRTGYDAQQGAFQGNLASRQQNVANALRGQTQPFEELGGMRGFLQQPEVGADNTMLQRDTAINQTAPVSAVAASENEYTTQLENQGVFKDRPGESPGQGARRKAKFDSLPLETRQLFKTYANPTEAARFLDNA